MWDCLVLPDFPPSARRQQAAGFLLFHMGRWQCGLGPQFGPLDGWQTEVQLKSKGKSTSVSRLYKTGPNIRALGFQAKTSSISHSKIKMTVLYRASMQLYICLLLFNDFGQKKNTNDYHCHGNQVGHSSRWGWGWMNDSHIGIHTRKCLGHDGI